jgi:hypothetical protein
MQELQQHLAQEGPKIILLRVLVLAVEVDDRDAGTALGRFLNQDGSEDGFSWRAP